MECSFGDIYLFGTKEKLVIKYYTLLLNTIHLLTFNHEMIKKWHMEQKSCSVHSCANDSTTTLIHISQR